MRVWAWRRAVECMALAVLAGGVAAAGAQAAPFAYVTNSGSGTVSQYELNAGGLLALSPPTVAAGRSPQSVAVSPDGGSVYLANYDDFTVSQYDVAAAARFSPRARPRSPRASGRAGWR